jgi:hypothetical protein
MRDKAMLVEPEEHAFQQVQRQFAGHIRDPQGQAAPAGIEDRRMAIYRDLFYRNIEGFIRGAFPVLHAILPEAQWHGLVRDFMRHYHCQSPYFLEISQEFIGYLQQREAQPDDPVYMLELAHYEWVELALDVADVEPEWAAIDATGDLLAGQPVVAATAWSLAYHYPVHRIGPGWQAEAGAEQPTTYLIVYRNREDAVKFMEINAVTARLLELIGADETLSGRQVLEQLAGEIGHHNVSEFSQLGLDILRKLQASGIVLGVRAQTRA